MEKTIKQTTIDLLIIAIGGVIFAFSISMFLNPYGVVPGGVTGTAMLLCELFPVLPLGMTVLGINLPLFLISFRLLGLRFVLYTGFGMLVSSVSIDFIALFPPINTEPHSYLVSAQMIDGILYGLNIERLVFIISDFASDIALNIVDRPGCGATFINGKGAFSGDERHIILCAIKRQEIVELKNIVRETDPNAFMIITDANEILGKGFLALEKINTKHRK